MLCQGLPDRIHKPAYAATLSALVTALREWPLLLTLANAALKERINSNQDLSEALADLRNDYEYHPRAIFKFIDILLTRVLYLLDLKSNKASSFHCIFVYH